MADRFQVQRCRHGARQLRVSHAPSESIQKLTHPHAISAVYSEPAAQNPNAYVNVRARAPYDRAISPNRANPFAKHICCTDRQSGPKSAGEPTQIATHL